MQAATAGESRGIPSAGRLYVAGIVSHDDHARLWLWSAPGMVCRTLARHVGQVKVECVADASERRGGRRAPKCK